MIKSGDLYELGRLPFIDLSSLQDNFNDLPADPYADERLRSRRYSCFTYKDGKLAYAGKKDFMQSSDINDYVGDVDRTYEDVEEKLLTNEIFVQMFDEFKRRADLGDNDIIEAHQLRWHCRARVKAPAPEGNHQDGFDYIAIYMVDHFNVDGGETMIFKEKTAPPMFKRKLENGEFVILNDKKLFHNAAPLVPTPNEDDGHWDVIVLTAHKGNPAEKA